MKRLSKKIILLVIVLGIMFMPMGTVKGALQANPDTYSKKQTNMADTWITIVRNMEKAGEAMGLNETLNNDLTASSESNNIDVHLVRSTEYGAVAILSVSGYGNPQTLQESEIKTTTGNKTGVYFTGTDGELVAGGLEGTIGKRQGTFLNANPIYYESYTSSRESAKVGDALGDATTTNPGCAGWHKASSNMWLYYKSGGQEDRGGVCYGRFIRGTGGIFSISFMNEYYSRIASGVARGVASCGQGL